MEKHIIHLTSPQLFKFKRGMGFQLSNQQIRADDGKNSVELHMNPVDIKKLRDAVKNRGFSNKSLFIFTIFCYYCRKYTNNDYEKVGNRNSCTRNTSNEI